MIRSITYYSALDQKKGPFKSIAEALEVANPGNVIKISPGVYTENIVISKPNLRFEPNERNGDIILLVEQGPALLIDLKPEERCYVAGLKISHHGNCDHLIDIETAGEDRNAILTVYNPAAHPNYEKIQADRELIRNFPFETYVNTLIFVKGGQVILEENVLSFNFLQRGFTGILPGIMIGEGTDVQVRRCNIIGNKNYNNVGIMMRMANVRITETKIQNNRLGGILMFLLQDNTVTVDNCKIMFNELCGIHGIGPDANPMIMK